MSNMMKALLAVLALTAGYAIYDFESPEYAIVESPPAASTLGTAAALDAAALSALALSDRSAEDTSDLPTTGWGAQDPFFRLPPAVEPDIVVGEIVIESSLTLMGIGTTVDGRRKLAVINNSIYSVGSVVDGKIIEAIELNHVMLRDENGSRMLPLTSSAAPTPTSPAAASPAAGSGLSIGGLLSGDLLENLTPLEILDALKKLTQSGAQP